MSGTGGYLLMLEGQRARRARQWLPRVEHRLERLAHHSLVGDGNSHTAGLGGSDWRNHMVDVAVLLDAQPRRLRWTLLGIGLGTALGAGLRVVRR